MPPPLLDALRFAAILGDLAGDHLPLMRELQRMRDRGELRHPADLFVIDWHALVTRRIGRRSIGAPATVPGPNAAQRARHYARVLAERLATLLPTAAVVHAIRQGDAPEHRALIRFFERHPDFDLGAAGVDADVGRRPEAWAGIADGERSVVRERLRGLQRLFRLTAGLPDQPELMRRLIAAGLDSAHAIASLDKDAFCRRFATLPFAVADAAIVHARAAEQAAAALVLFARHSPLFNSVPLAAIDRPARLAGAPATAASGAVAGGPASGTIGGAGGGGDGPRVPDWDRLFGPLNRSVFDQSVLSPAAYLVDLLHMLQGLDLLPAAETAAAAPTPAISALDLLRQRRPDITRVELSAANTDTLLPYVDLVNEVLEAAVFPSGFRITEDVDALKAELEATSIGARLSAAFAQAGFVLSPEARLEFHADDYKWLVVDDKYLHLISIGEEADRREHLAVSITPTRPHQTRGSAADLRVNPEHVDGDAYAVLQKAVYPWAVPFDLWAEEARIYLQHLGMPRHELMALFLDPALGEDQPARRDAAVAAEAFGLTQVECDLLAGRATVPLSALWGFDAADAAWTEALASVPAFLRRAGLEHRELVDLLATRYVNPKRQIRICHPPRETPEQRITRAPGNVDDAKLEALDLGALDRLQRVVRLQRKAGWSIGDLDKVLAALGRDAEQRPALDGALLVGAHAVRTLQQRLELPLDELLSWFADIDTSAGGDGTPSFYDRLFHDQSLQGGAITAFELDTGRAALREDIVLDAANKAALGAALQIGLREVDPLVEAVRSSGTTRLGLAALSRLHRAASMRRALKLSVEDFLALRALHGCSGDDPVAPGAGDPTRAATSFLAAARRVEASGFAIEELDYLLRHRIRPQATGASHDAGVGQLLGEIRDGLRRIQEENRLPETADERSLAELLRQKLGKLNWDDETLVQPLLAALAAGGAAPPTLRTFDPTQETPLAELPAGVDERMRAAFANRLSYDAGRRTLRLRGAIGESEVQTLVALAADAAPWVDAIRRLRALQDQPPAPDDVFLDDPEAALRALPDAGARMRCVLARLLPRVQRLDGEALLVRHLGEALGLELAAAQRLVLRPAGDGSGSVAATLLDAAFVGSDGVPDPDRFPAPFAACHWLQKMALLVQRLRIRGDELPWLFGADRPAGLLDPDALPLAGDADVAVDSTGAGLQGLLGLADLFAVRDRIGAPALEALRALRAESDDARRRQQAVAFAQAFGWAAEDIERLVLNSRLLDEWSIDALRRCEARLSALKKLDIHAATAQAWSQPEVTAAVAAAIKQTAKARHEQRRWLEVAGPLRDTLRERQRSTLVACLVAARRLPDSYALYQHFLIDVDMGARTMTSRIKLAISAVQLLVQRLLMNLEDWRIPAEQAPACKAQWQSLKNYRVWEANRKIFLYPENWIEPELRKDKTALFRELESELQQGEPNMAAAERALRSYLERLDTLARLEICAIAADPAPGADVLHVFGRTRSLPRSYHHRRRENGVWTGWEPLEAGVDGDHLIPVVMDHRPYLFWAEFGAQTAAVVRTASGRKLAIGGSATLQTWEYWELRLAFSEYRQGAWSPKKLLDGRLAVDLPLGSTQRDGEIVLGSEVAPPPLDKEVCRPRLAPSRFTFRAEIDETAITLRCLRTENDQGRHGYTDQGTLRFTADERLDASAGQGPFDAAPLAAAFHHEGMALVPDAAGAPLALHGRAPILQRTPRRRITVAGKEPSYAPRGVRVVCAPQPTAPDRAVAFVYQDDDRTFLIVAEPSGACRVENFYHPSATAFLKQVHRSGVRGLLQLDQQQRRRETVLFRIPRDEAGFFDANRVEEVRRNFTSPQRMAVLDDRGWTRLETITLATVQAGREWQVSTPEFSCTVRVDDGSLLVEQDVRQQYGKPELAAAEQVPPLPEGRVDFALGGAYAPYNWELFFHMPLLLADRLSRNQRFEDSQSWFHHVFDPTDLSPEPAPQRYWKVAPFFDEARQPPVVELLELAGYGGPPDSAFGRRKDELARQVASWRAAPFDPHAIAHWRASAYQKTVVMKYLDNLVGWGDQLFRQDTIESINEATQLYVLAAEILGKRPLVLPGTSEGPGLGFDGLQARASASADPFIRLEDLVPVPSQRPPEPQPGGDAFPAATLRHYFCVPGNDKLLGYWDLVADRLGKIRHSQNIEGTERQLALFEPPIEPGLLVRAAAAGVDITSALRDVSVPLPHYRFRVMLAKALAFCDDVRALGADFLAALEKKDELGLEQLRLRQVSFDLQRRIGHKAIEEAQQQVADLEEARALVTKQIAALDDDISLWRGAKGFGTAFGLLQSGFKVGKSAFEGAKATTQMSSRGDYVKGRSAAEKGATGTVEKATPHGQRSISTLMLAHSMYSAASTATSFPTVVTGGAGVSSPVALVVTGGGQVKSVWENLGKAFETAGKVAEIVAEVKKSVEELQQKVKDAEARRDAAQAHDNRLGKQLAAASVRVEIAQLRQKAIDKAAESAEQVEAYLRGRFTSLELHGWRVSQLSTLYFQTYQMAYDMAKRAERAFEHELGDLGEFARVRFGHWDSLRKGLLAGEQLHFDLRRMEKAYLDQDRRCHEITRHVSLKDELPDALSALDEGACSFELPEALFDRDYPGHYMRRIRSVRLTVTFAGDARPANVSCTLALLASSVRMRVTTGAYARRSPTEPDPRFRDEIGAVQSIVTSSGRDDGGVFERGGDDPRYLPFEGAGAISRWKIDLPRAQPAGDRPARVEDVVLHLSYTARDGGSALKETVLREARAQARKETAN